MSVTLPVAVVLGMDVPELGGLVGRIVAEQTLKSTADALVVTTWVQAVRREEDEISQALRHQESGISVNPLMEAKLSTRGSQEPDQRVG